MDWNTRLIFIGLWSYVDDNGVGRDVEKLILAELFPLEDDPRDTLATLSRGLQTLSEGGQITRYEVDGKPLLHVTGWNKWQKIDRPGKARYEPPTSENASIRDTLATSSRDIRETPSTGEGEKWRRGEVKASAPAARVDARFDEFWSAYPLKKGKDGARRVWDRVIKREDPDAIIAGAASYADQVRNIEDRSKIKYPQGWLNDGRWKDEPNGGSPSPGLSNEQLFGMLK